MVVQNYRIVQLILETVYPFSFTGQGAPGAKQHACKEGENLFIKSFNFFLTIKCLDFY